MRRVLIYRHQLFKPSEPFITQQAGALRRFEPVFAGRTRLGPAPDGATVRTLDGTGVPRILRQALFADPEPLADRVRDIEPVLIHAHFGVEGVYAVKLAARLGIPLVTTFHGFDATASPGELLRAGKVSWVRYALSRRGLARKGDLFLCTSEYIRERLLALGFPPERVRTHYIGVDTACVRPSDGPAASDVVLHVARLVEVKGTTYLLDAFETVTGSVPGATLSIIGDGPLRTRLEAQARRLGITHRVRFHGAEPHGVVCEWLARSAMLVLPSVETQQGRAEGLGMVLLEAAAAGVPVVATRCGGIAEIVEDGETGYLVPQRDRSALAKRILALLSDPEARTAMGQRARWHAERRFDLGRQTRALEDLYESLL